MKTCSAFLACAAGLVPLGAVAAESSAWKQQFTAYMIGAAMDGSTTVGGITAPVDVSFSDIMDNLEFGAMANYRAEKDRLSLNLDVIFMGLGFDGPNGRSALDFDQIMVEGSTGWRLSDNVEILGGARYNKLDGSVRLLDTEEPRSASQDKSWVDPFVGAWARVPLSQSFAILLRGDVGGFGVGSEMAYQFAGYLRYQTSGSVSIVAGWRYLDQDYEEGEGARRFVYDVTTQGPVLGLGWHF
ncbi:MAG: hypothetical protein IAE82_15865 [Opitutaceae bacterium]|nr:hypothetical protein [Opitutaceae bacterium]